MAVSCASETAGRAVALRARGLELAPRGRDAAVLEAVDLDLIPGECVWLQGPTGSGKSTLLRALAGVGGVERRRGTIERSGPVSLLFQEVDPQLLCTTVHEEVALGLRSRGVPESVVESRICRALVGVGLGDVAGDREVDALSAGQRQRVVLAALLALEPRVLLLDEPSSALDPEARRDLAGVLRGLVRDGTGLLLADHAPAELSAIVDRRLRIETGRIVAPAPDGRPEPAAREGAGCTGSRRCGDAAERDPLPLRAGERLLLTGPNGSGKSTWLRRIAQEAEGGEPGSVALVIQSPRRSLFARTVREEIGFVLRRRGSSRDARRARIEELLERVDLQGAADRSPLRLSFGQQHRLAIAASVAAGPRLWLLDEPFAGLDPQARGRLLDWIREEQARAGATVVVASHDRAGLADWCDRVVALPGRRSGPREVGA